MNKTFYTNLGSVSFSDFNLTPDILVRYNNYTFCLISASISPTNKEEFLIDAENTTHSHLVSKLFDNGETPYVELLDKGLNFISYIEKNPHLGITGRMLISNPQLIAFWETESPFLKKALEYLNKYITIQEDAIIHVGKKFYSMDSINSIQKTSDEDKEGINKARELHLMNPNQKKIEMEKLGLSSYSKYHPLHEPGRKWWAPTSESFKMWLESIIEIPDINGIIKVLKNPSFYDVVHNIRDVSQYGNYIRGMLSANNDVYIWSGEYEHYYVKNKLKESIKIAFDFAKHLDGSWLLSVSKFSSPEFTDGENYNKYKNILLNNPKIQNMLNGFKFK